MIRGLIDRKLPKELEALPELALNLRFTWGQVGEKLWRTLSPEIWEATKNPWVILQNVPKERFEELSKDDEWMEEFQDLLNRIKEYVEDPCWYGRQYPAAGLKGIAYFSMEFGVSEALPLYAGGLGGLAGDFLKTANDLGLPVIGIGLLYQEGYFRQLLDASGWQQETYPFNEPASLPIRPVPVLFGHLAARFTRYAGTPRSAENMASRHRPSASVFAGFQRPSQWTSRSGDYEQALWWRHGNAPHAGVAVGVGRMAGIESPWP